MYDKVFKKNIPIKKNLRQAVLKIRAFLSKKSRASFKKKKEAFLLKRNLGQAIKKKLFLLKKI